MKKFKAPLIIGLDITNKCNLCCKHCYASSTRNNKELSFDQLIKIIRQIIDLKIFKIIVSGGEPLARKDVFTILNELSQSRVNITLATNATLITKPIAKKLKGLNIKIFTVSLDGPSAYIHDALRGEGSFKKTLKGIKNLINEKCPVTISATVTKINYRHLEKLVMLAKKLGTFSIKFDEVSCVGNAKCFRKELVLTIKEKIELLGIAEKLKTRFGDFVRGCIFTDLEKMKKIGRIPLEKFPLAVGPCPAGNTLCEIRPDGWVIPCGILWNKKAGDLKKQTLYDIWNNSSIMKEFRKIMFIKKKDLTECSPNCKYIAFCYKGHRCYPYYQTPGKKFKHKELFCWNLS